MTLTPAIKKKITSVALIVLCALILFGVVLTVCLLNMNKSVIKVDLKPGETQSIEFNDLCLLPSGQTEYTILFGNEYTNKYQVSLNFEDVRPEYTLKNYAYVRIEKDGTVLCDKLLSDMLGGDSPCLTVDFSEKSKNEIKIIYYMPEDVGNEAQGAEADFKLLITAANG